MKTIKNIRDLLSYFGADAIAALSKAVYDSTECGAQITLYTNYPSLSVSRAIAEDEFDREGLDEIGGFKITSILEGSDAEFDAGYVNFPTTEEAVKQKLAEIDAIVDGFINLRDHYLTKVRIWTKEHGGLYKLESTGNGFEWVDPELNFDDRFPDRLKTEIPAVLNDIDDMEIPFHNESDGAILSYIQNKAKEFTTKSGDRFKAWVYYHTDDEIDPRAATR